MLLGVFSRPVSSAGGEVPGVCAVLGVVDVLGDRGLRFPPGHWGL